ncbi:MAG: DUF3883 domain-containing protein [Deltaproteobacteria bacterium]|nr:DUF3883 domain-containing protein [Deltaproteobacteria bacterium]MBW2136045.1 DUF3883 domain-containing protein [Deltaproteobacteria bacterium]
MCGNENKTQWDNKAINAVREEKERHRDSEDLEGMQDILESVILKTSHLPLEFIQNAEDEKSSTVGFHLYDSALIIYNDGRPFRIEEDRNDIKGFCSIGLSQKYKKGIGFLGVGAKTVFTITRKPWVVSGKYNFTVENMLYPSPQSEFPPLSFPVAQNLPDFPKRGAIFYSPLLPDTQGKRDTSYINEILGNMDQSVIMFLDSVETVEVRDFRPNGSLTTFKRSPIESYVEDDPDRPGGYTCKKIRISTQTSGETKDTQITTTDWIVGNLNISISGDAKKNLPPSKLYDKKRASKMTRVSVAIPINRGENQLYSLYCYLPLRESLTGLPIILQGDFIPEADRNHIRTDLLWNTEILESLGALLAKVIQTCSESNQVDFQLPDLVPWESDISPFLEPFVKSFKGHLLNTRFKLGDSASSIELKDYIICNPDTSYLSQEDLRPVHLNNHFRLFLGPNPNSKLRRCLEWIGVRTLSANDIFKVMLEREKSGAANPVWVFNCYYSLAKADERDEIDAELLELMKNRSWLLTNRRGFTKPHDLLYFRMPRAKKEIQHIEDFAEVEFLHPIFTTFGGSRKYGVDKEKRDVIRQFLIDTFSVKILEDEGHLIRNLVVPLLSSNELSPQKRVQHFTALLFYHEKLQKKLMKDAGHRTDFEKGKKRLQERCKNILVPATTYDIKQRKQVSSGLIPLEQVYIRGNPNRSGPAFSILGRTPCAYFLSTSFLNKVSKRLQSDQRETVAALEAIGITSNLKILEKKYKESDATPFPVNTNLVDWSLTDHQVPGLDRLDVVALAEDPETVHIILKELSSQYKHKDHANDFLTAIFRSSKSYSRHESSVARALKRVKLKARDRDPYHLKDFVSGAKFTELIPNHNLLLPFNTKGMDKFLSALQVKAEPSQEELISAIKDLKTQYGQKGGNLPRSDIERLCKIYQELSNYESAQPEIYLRSPYFDSCWFKPEECYWSDPTTQFRKYHPVIGDFYKKIGFDKPQIFKKFGVNPYPSVEDIFGRISGLRKNINKRKNLPTHEEINELRCYYKYLSGKEIPEKLISRKMFLTDSGILVDGSSIYTSRNVELHKFFAREMPQLILNRNLAQDFPPLLEKVFGVKPVEATIDSKTIPFGTENHDLTVKLRLLIRMVATYEFYNKKENTQEPHFTELQELSESINVVDVEKIELKVNLNGSRIPVLLHTLFLDNRLYLTDIRDNERLLSRIQEYGLVSILRGCSNDALNFANQIIADGIDIDSMQESFFKQGFSREYIKNFLAEMRITDELKFEKPKTAEKDEHKEATDTDTAEDEKKEDQVKKRQKKKIDDVVPELADPFEYEIESIKESEFLNGRGKEIGFRKRSKAKGKSRSTVPPPPPLSTLGVQERGIEFVKMACREIFGIENEGDIKDVHRDLKEYDIILFPKSDRKYVEVKASLSDPSPALTRDEFEKAKEEKENYYLFLVGNIETKAGDVYVRYIPNPASHNHVRLGGARLKDIKWEDWGNVKFARKTKKEHPSEI